VSNNASELLVDALLDSNPKLLTPRAMDGKQKRKVSTKKAII